MTLPVAQERVWIEAQAVGRTRKRWLRELLANVIPAAIGLAAVLAVWEAWVRLRDVKPYIVPSPSRVAERLYADPWLFAEEGLKTLEGAMLGFLVGAGVAFALATVMAQSRFLERSIFPLAILVKVTPIVAVAPLLTIWFGFGLMPKVFIAALIVFFPIMVNALVGFRSVNPNALALLESLAASRSEVFLRLRLPSSLPYVFAAFRVSIPLSVIGAVVAEWFSGDRGLGSVIYIANNNLDMATAFGGVFTLAIIGVGLFLLTSALERRLLFWHESTLDVR
ncbi:MAG: ABC transporter permease subunit [Dehalococcoidia bacterium]|nr:ABC transporter permease subunit [Dehalococcoidia bacterium]